MDNSLPKILIIDDKPANLTAMKSMLAKVDAQLFTAESGNETLALCLKNDFALLLLDVQMPDMDGYQVAEFLRDEPQTRHMPIIFVTAYYAEEKNKLKAYCSGGVDFILKPIDTRILLSKVEIFLNLYNQKHQLQRQATLLEEQNARLERELIHRQEMDVKIQKALKAAESGNRAKSRFLAAMSHEVRTPLNGVLGFAQLLTNSELNEKQRRHVDTIIRSGNDLLLIINDILDFSKVESGVVELNKVAFDLGPLVEEVINLLTPRARQQEVELLWQFFPDIPTRLIGDPQRLKQVLGNLIGNAIKFTEGGLVTLYIKLKEATSSRAVLEFMVDDSGIGIPKEALDQLLVPFYQVDGSSTRRFGGTGLGLAISSGLVELMGGGMEVKSTEGLGSSFRFSARFEKPTQQPLPSPIRKPATPPVDQHTQRPPVPFGGLNLLVAEDEPMAQSLIGEILVRLGFAKVEAVSNGQEVLDRMEAGRYDLIIMDCRMPVMDGYRATQEIRRLEKAQNFTTRIPIIALTANAMQEEQKACFDAGMDAFVAKPFRIEELKATIQKMVSTSMAKGAIPSPE
ncbi:MAG: response regulator [Magnetococcales bacterium]|nr:response regulator [Magnetococcales bacterium]